MEYDRQVAFQKAKKKKSGDNELATKPDDPERSDKIKTERGRITMLAMQNESVDA